MIVDELAQSEKENEDFELFPMNSKTLRGKKRRYRASPATRIICASSMIVLVCLVGAAMHFTSSDRRRLSGDGAASKAECNNSLDQIPELAVFIYALCLIVLFIGLANITDDFFVPALTVTGKRLDLSEDVTGATLMASGSSAPELFTSGVDAFLHGTSIGIGTVVGSAVFNILVIIACSGAWATESLVIDWKPFTRDCSFYSLSIILLVVLIEWDGDEVGRIWWWEGLIMFLCYGFYVTIMAYNKQLMACMAKLAGEEEGAGKGTDNATELQKAEKVTGAIVIFDPKDSCSKEAFEHFQTKARDIKDVQENGVKPYYEQSMFCVEFESNVESKKINKVQLQEFAKEAVADAQKEADKIAQSIEAVESKLKVECKVIELKCPGCDNVGANEAHKDDEADTEKSKYKCSCFLTGLEMAAGFLTDGWGVVFKHIPDVNSEEMCDEYEIKPTDKLKTDIEKKEKGYQCTFALSILWIGIICIFMVECAERIGCLIGIKSLFMGLTVLAAGTSIPDALGSIASAKRGMGDMAVANAIGSNVFDILIGLGLPWCLRGLIYHEPYNVLVDDLIIFIGILFSTIFITLLAFVITKWKLSPTLGKILLVAYFIFIFFAFVYVYLG